VNVCEDHNRCVVVYNNFNCPVCTIEQDLEVMTDERDDYANICDRLKVELASAKRELEQA
jgi:protein-disulfide isomerase